MAQGNYKPSPIRASSGRIIWKVNSQRKVPEFKSTLDELHDLSKSAPEKPEATAAFEKSVQSIDKIAAVPKVSFGLPNLS